MQLNEGRTYQRVVGRKIWEAKMSRDGAKIKLSLFELGPHASVPKHPKLAKWITSWTRAVAGFKKTYMTLWSVSDVKVAHQVDTRLRKKLKLVFWSVEGRSVATMRKLMLINPAGVLLNRYIYDCKARAGKVSLTLLRKRGKVGYRVQLDDPKRLLRARLRRWLGKPNKDGWFPRRLSVVRTRRLHRRIVKLSCRKKVEVMAVWDFGEKYAAEYRTRGRAR